MVRGRPRRPANQDILTNSGLAAIFGCRLGFQRSKTPFTWRTALSVLLRAPLITINGFMPLQIRRQWP